HPQRHYAHARHAGEPPRATSGVPARAPRSTTEDRYLDPTGPTHAPFGRSARGRENPSREDTVEAAGGRRADMRPTDEGIGARRVPSSLAARAVASTQRSTWRR